MRTFFLSRASRNLHDMMFKGLTKTFMLFFNRNSSGRILNRFSEDIGNIDTELPQTLFECFGVSFEKFNTKDILKTIEFFTVCSRLYRCDGPRVSH